MNASTECKLTAKILIWPQLCAQCLCIVDSNTFSSASNDPHLKLSDLLFLHGSSKIFIPNKQQSSLEYHFSHSIPQSIYLISILFIDVVRLLLFPLQCFVSASLSLHHFFLFSSSRFFLLSSLTICFCFEVFFFNEQGCSIICVHQFTALDLWQL